MDNPQGNLLQTISGEISRGLNEMTYSIGAIFGDGSVGSYPLSSGGITYTVTIQCMDYEIVERVRNEVDRFFNESHNIMTITKPSGKPSYQVSFHSVYVNALFNYFVKDKHFIPDEVFNLDRDLRLDFIAGLFDTDGYVSVGARYRVGFASRHRTFVEDLARMLKKLGVQVGAIYTQVSQYGTIMYVIKPNIKSFIESGCYFYCPRKYNKIKGYAPKIVEHYAGSKTFRDYNAGPTTENFQYSG